MPMNVLAIQALDAREFVAQIQRALALPMPDQPWQQMMALAWVFGTSPDASLRHGAVAVRLALEANRFSHFANAEALQVLAAAYAEAGRFAEAVETVVVVQVPVIVAVMGLYAQLQANWLPIAGGLTASTFVTMAVAGWSGQWLLRRRGEVADGG